MEKISLLPYHKFGEAKYAALGKTYPWKDKPEISEAQVEKLRRLVESRGIAVEVGR